MVGPILLNDQETETHMDIGKFIGHLINIGLILGTLGVLMEVTATLRSEAVATHERGMVSLGAFNRRLHHGR